jgi:hypothetical protein
MIRIAVTTNRVRVVKNHAVKNHAVKNHAVKNRVVKNRVVKNRAVSRNPKRPAKIKIKARRNKPVSAP